ncbi:MAG: Nitrogen fixation protein VnfA [Candidatus Omnitrophica bacterium ADurb.Bin277]|nr:MAG: Nitrogen fixation protein VnfA [Candidatus Omnitrophica bacterium ADurb.Bin277]
MPPKDAPSNSIAGLEREVLELRTLNEITRQMTMPHPLEERMRKALEILHEKMGMHHGTLTILDVEGGHPAIEIVHGPDKQAIKLGRYRVGEGITGKVVESGEPMAVPGIGEEPIFLNRTGARGRDSRRSRISFICVPIKMDRQTIGALGTDRLSRGNVSLDEDMRFLTIISSIIAQTVATYRIREREKEKLQFENTELKRELAKRFHPGNIIGESKRMKEVYAAIDMVSQTRSTVLLRGETGTGKELVAHAIHYASLRSKGPFIKISCAALPGTLLESELFGYEKGAFTGAVSGKPGRFEMADGGTLFLDEIGDIPPSIQTKLLRVLQEKEFERMGGTRPLKVDIRLIAATNRDLETAVREGKFREDLYYRLNVVPILLPSLRDRREDIPLLVVHFLKKAGMENGKPVKYISDAAMTYLMSYAWPGNIRELENAVERAVILCKSDTIEEDLFPIPGQKDHPAAIDLKTAPRKVPEINTDEDIPPEGGLSAAVEKLEKKMIQTALARTAGNQRRAARMLGVTERILGYKIKNYDLK